MALRSFASGLNADTDYKFEFKSSEFKDSKLKGKDSKRIVSLVVTYDF